ncbi:MAG: DedA family protein [Bacteroidaceae bacterium]|nr:DedA family protein [Bacteroidaceae bacterium]
MQDIILWLFEHLNYWTVTIFMAIESSFIPFPSEVVVPPAAWLSGSSDELTFIGVVIFATLGADTGALVNYYLAKFLGRPFVYKFARSRWGRYCLIHEEQVKQAEEYFVKNGATSTFVGRLVPGIRQLISIPAGLANMHLGKFLLYTTLGAGIWNFVLAAIGYAIFKAFPAINTPKGVAEKAAEYSHQIGYGILAVVALCLVYFLIKKFVRK